MKFELNEFNRNISTEEMIEDLKRSYEIAKKNNKKLTSREYNKIGKYTSGTISLRFGKWNEALLKAGLIPNLEKNISEADLFSNLEKIWIEKGSQPVYRDLNTSTSKYHASAYALRFGSWRDALKAFIDYINQDPENEIETISDIASNDSISNEIKHKTSRNISDRMRFRILARDGFTCQSCGATPIKTRGIELHVDHIIPWSRGGETVEINLQTKCQKCNIGKGNAFTV
ncbi:hypothetical protein LPTSP3_g31010 [Leptospira kobayashii]|uniref:HNH nuclease domain-containing protein n=1 Tax=Leptospira kobayashii TaxID=1917830 RepID=A0ABN6KJP8_9LEPT|nr:HNH endonuclease [Leptospira kobayashii]BDA80171.1 hypothetical protein LPTSP3_g31010 [Leptospira kobayashii]